MDPHSQELQRSLLGACRNVPKFLSAGLARLSGEKQELAKGFIETFKKFAFSEQVYREETQLPTVCEELLEALYGSAPLSTELGNQQLAKMLLDTFSHASAWSSMMYLNHLIAQGEREAENVAAQVKRFVSARNQGSNRTTSEAAKATAGAIEFFEQRANVDQYAASLANHLLNAYAR